MLKMFRWGKGPLMHKKMSAFTFFIPLVGVPSLPYNLLLSFVNSFIFSNHVILNRIMVHKARIHT